MSIFDGHYQPSEEAMYSRQASIPEDERCEKCKGMGWLDVGCAIVRRIYWCCCNCGGSGRKSDTIAEIKKRIKARKENPR
jgi:excinuclease UvrABC ATPase subunit